MQDKLVALVTGANQGIGFEIAKMLVNNGFTVLVGSRSTERGEAAAVKLGPSAVAIQLDVTDHWSIAAAAERVRVNYRRLDVLVQNAAIATATHGGFESGEELAKASRPSVASLDDVRAVWETNVFGVLAVYQAMVPILRKTPNSRIINVSSGMGSLTLNSDPSFPLRPLFDVTYSASKTALNALTLAMAIELEAEGINVNAVSPGHTRTGLTGFFGTDTPEEGAAEAVRVALLGSAGPTGTFTHASMGIIPW
ncbi:SDR family NAD(P)-dependent oxidoreductase [Belnapia sp. T18]|uniref:SDR family NAD(P)-dependent oxidoreductase n=1 Tax=Belnapia arida TaxID=2804533 RepID=A0ABS1UC21_9PROT|nr:SDR family NAD(P)-dependent oxidoreductase [Belnapia arida]MBL6081700.1 SDR family NAD(P)-dependent oxidoreductase [Belnapia arida]